MVVLSKLFKPPMKYLSCSQTPLHCGKTCYHSVFEDVFKFTLSALRYYSPLVVSPLLLKGQAVSINNFLDTFKFYLEAVFASSLSGSFVFFFICLFRMGRGEFEMWTTYILPAFLAAQGSWLYSKRTLRIFSTTTTQVTLEALLRQNKNVLTQFLLNSTAMQTFIFMMTSTIIMHFKRLHQYNGFWFIKPEIMPEKNRKNEDMPNEAEESETIWKYLLKDSKKYLIYGLGLDFFNTILKSFDYCKTKEASQFFSQMVKGLRFNMTYFFISYVGIYKISLYYLNRHLGTGYSSEKLHAVAAFLGGSSYAFLNKITCNTLAIVLAVQILWQNFCRQSSKTKDENSVLEIVKKIPFAQIFFPINMGYLVYMFFQHHDCVNSLGKNLLNAVTDHKIQRMFDYIRQTDIDLILRKSTI